MRSRLTMLTMAGAVSVLVMLVGCQQARSQAADAGTPAAPAAVAETAAAPAGDLGIGLPFTGLGPDVAYARTTDLTNAWHPAYFPEDPGPPSIPDGVEAASVMYAGGDLDVGIAVLYAEDPAKLEAPFGELAPAGAPWWFDAPEGAQGLSGAILKGADGAGYLLLAGAKEPADAREAVAMMRRMIPVVLPEKLGEWSLTEPATYDTKTIYDYIDGGADRPMRFGFEAMYGGRYVRDTDKIVADVYQFRSGPDAFGLFTCQAKGKPVDLGAQACIDGGRALYLWQGCYYIEVKAGTRGTDLTAPMKDIARSVLKAVGPKGMLPPLAEKLGRFASDVAHMHFVHEPNEQMNYFYLSTANVLHLGPGTDGLIIARSDPPRPEILLAVRYPSPDDRAAALRDSVEVIQKPGTTLTPGEPYEWDTGRFVFVPREDDLPPGTLVMVLDSLSGDGARSLAQEALACLR